jgi:hypothetical protein
LFLVSARARQLNHRLKNRRNAIVTRRENDASLHAQSRHVNDVWRDSNGHVLVNGHTSSHASPSGFVAVNAHRPEGEHPEENPLSAQFMFSHSNTDNVTMINGQSIKGASPTTRADLMKRFFTTADRHARGYDDATAPANPQPLPRPRTSELAEYSLYNPATANPVAIPSTPSSLLPPPKSTHQEKDDGGPFKLEMIARMEELQRGERLIPPCDRCRRLHMDCLKNLTACVGCTKKHAKCSWRDVKEDEVAAMLPRPTTSTATSHERVDHDHSIATLTPPQFGAGPLPPISAERERPREPPFEPEVHSYHQSNRRESAPSAPNPALGSAAPMELPSNNTSPRRAVSETENGRHRIPAIRASDRPEDDDPDANQRLRQAILDTVDHQARVAAAVQEKERGAERGGKTPGVGVAVLSPGQAPVPAVHDREREREREPDRDRDRRMVHA